MTNGELINEIGALMEEDKMSVAAYRRLMLRSVSGLLDKQVGMDEVALVVKEHIKDIDKLQKRDNLNNIVTAVVAAFAAIVGFDK